MFQEIVEQLEQRRFNDESVNDRIVTIVSALHNNTKQELGQRRQTIELNININLQNNPEMTQRCVDKIEEVLNHHNYPLQSELNAQELIRFFLFQRDDQQYKNSFDEFDYSFFFLAIVFWESWPTPHLTLRNLLLELLPVLRYHEVIAYSLQGIDADLRARLLDVNIDLQLERLEIFRGWPRFFDSERIKVQVEGDITNLVKLVNNKDVDALAEKIHLIHLAAKKFVQVAENCIANIHAPRNPQECLLCMESVQIYGQGTVMHTYPLLRGNPSLGGQHYFHLKCLQDFQTNTNKEDSQIRHLQNRCPFCKYPIVLSESVRPYIRNTTPDRDRDKVRENGILFIYMVMGYMMNQLIQEQNELIHEQKRQLIQKQNERIHDQESLLQARRGGKKKKRATSAKKGTRMKR